MRSDVKPGQVVKHPASTAFTQVEGTGENKLYRDIPLVEGEWSGGMHCMHAEPGGCGYFP